MTETKDVLLFYPNLIGYGRVICGLTSFALMIFYQELWPIGKCQIGIPRPATRYYTVFIANFFRSIPSMTIAILLYLSSFIGDLFDGLVARKYDQCSEFGGMLDMVTDRCATLGLLFILYGEYGYDNWYKLVRV